MNEIEPQLPVVNESENTILALDKPNSRQVFRICLNLKKFIDKLITSKKSVGEIDKLAEKSENIQLALKACGGKGDGEPGTSSKKYRSAIIYSLIIVNGWYDKLTEVEFNTINLNTSRKLFCEYLSRHIIEHFLNTNESYLFINVLSTKFQISLNGVDQPATNVLEMAIDSHSIPIITSYGFQKCIKYLWRGWIVQSSKDAQIYEIDKNYSSRQFKNHFNSNRLKTPKYQNYMEIFFSFVYLIIFTVIVNCEDKSEYLSFEFCFYLMTISFVADELINIYHAGLNYLKFWNYFNDVMYTFILIALVFRVYDDDEIKSFRLLSCVAPFMWTRLLFYLDCFEYVGVIIVVISKMMKESFLFFVLLSIVVIGFLQGFMGLDTSDGQNNMFPKILHAMIKSIIAGSQFPVFDNLTPPYSVYVYYVFRFLINVMLMKILSALYNNSYKETVGQSSNEYLALFSSKVLRYIRAPDEFVYIPPLNLIEAFVNIITTGLNLPEKVSNLINYYVLQAIYSPILFIITISELKEAKRINYNRLKSLSDDANEIDLEWDLTDGYVDSGEANIDNTDILNNDLEGLTDTEYNEAVVRQGVKLQKVAEREDPEFIVNINDFNRSILKPEDKSSSDKKEVKKPVGKEIETDVENLGNQITSLLNYIEKLSEENKAILDRLNKLENN